jgi:hypothetical protein
MVAFGSAPSALQWGLLVQEAAMYLDYPPTFERVHQVRLDQWQVRMSLPVFLSCLVACLP